jgi:ribonuclease BN (tRNA processing enzyme)
MSVALYNPELDSDGKAGSVLVDGEVADLSDSARRGRTVAEVRWIVISGDTTRSDGLVALARGADILVHEVLFPEGVDRLVAGVKNAANLKQSILAHHTTVEDVGRVAQAAGVKMLVLSHLVPAEDPAITDRMWIDAASRHFRGRVVTGRDLLEI